MNTVFIEATSEAATGQRAGRFVVGRFTVRDLAQDSKASPDDLAVLAQLAWDPRRIWVMDLDTRQGAAFQPGGVAADDVREHGIRVGPLFVPFLGWLYDQDLSDIRALPRLVRLHAPVASRRPGSPARAGSHR